jgi:hypothetical protein
MASFFTMKSKPMMVKGRGSGGGVIRFEEEKGGDREAAGHGGACAWGDSGSGSLLGEGKRGGVGVSWASQEPRPKRSGGGQAVKRWARPIWVVGLKQRKYFRPNFKLNFGIWQGFEILYMEI